VPLEWLELRCIELKRKALENDISLVPNEGENTATIMNKKQIILSFNDKATGEAIIQNAALLQAINLHNLANN